MAVLPVSVPAPEPEAAGPEAGFDADARFWVLVFGTRPEATKLVSVARALKARGAQVMVLRTGQHRELLEQTADGPGLAAFLRGAWTLEVPQAADPGILADYVAARVEREITSRNLVHRILGVIVQGDTASANGAAVAAHKLGLPLAHVEAGIRSGDDLDPWPEERFRVAIDRMASWHYPTTPTCATNLANEGVVGTIPVVGSTGIDSLAEELDGLPHEPLEAADRVLLTLHRRERWARMATIVDALDGVAKVLPETHFIWPVHPNPILRKAAESLVHIKTVPAMGSVAFRRLLAGSRLVVTDSGGVQEEAAALGVPCLVVRTVTDRPESVEAGVARVIGCEPQAVAKAVWDELREPTLPRRCFGGYGDGRAGKRIAALLLGA